MTDLSSRAGWRMLAATAAITIGAAVGVTGATDASPGGPAPASMHMCPDTGPCRAFPGRLVIPTNALARTSDITPSERGLRWANTGGRVLFTVPRPLDYRGGPVRVVLFHCVSGDDEGTLRFGFTSVNLRAGGGYETYGGNSTGALPANADTHYEQWAVLAPEGGGFSGTGPWWHVEINRNSTYSGPLQLINVLVEYR